MKVTTDSEQESALYRQYTQLYEEKYHKNLKRYKKQKENGPHNEEEEKKEAKKKSQMHH